MGMVKVALDRPYTFIILALLILLLSPVIILSYASFGSVALALLVAVRPLRGLHQAAQELAHQRRTLRRSRHEGPGPQVSSRHYVESVLQ